MAIADTCGNDYDKAFTRKDSNADVNDRYPVPAGG